MPSTCSIRSLYLGSRRATHFASDHKTSFSRSNPRMRGQATSTRPSVRQRPKPSNNRRSLTGIEVSLDPDQSSLHNTDKTGTKRRSRRANQNFPGRQYHAGRIKPIQGDSPSPIVRRTSMPTWPERSKRSLRQREDKKWWS